MAITNVIPEIWADSLYEGYETSVVWAGLLTDLSNQVVDGDKVHLGNIDGTTTTIRDYARNTDIADPEIIDDAVSTLNLDQLKYFNFAVDDVDQVQSRPELMGPATAKYSRAVAEVVDKFIYELVKGAAVGTKASTGKITPLAASNFTAGRLKDQTTGQDTFDALLKAINSVVESMDAAGVPEDGRYMVVRRDMAAALRYGMVEQGLPSGLTDTALANGQVARLMGLTIVKDNNIAVTDKEPVAIAGHRSGTVFAQQIQQIEAYRPDNRMADAVKGLWVYGGLQLHADGKYLIQQGA